MPESIPIRFAEKLNADLADASLGKGERTRLRVLAAGAKLMNERPYDEIRMSDVAAEAGLSNGALYRYYEDKRDLTIAVFTEFVRFNQRALLRRSIPADPRRALQEAYAFHVELYAANVGLMAALRRLTVEIPEIGALVEAGYDEWSSQLAVVLKSLGIGDSSAGEGELAWTIRALSAMTSEFLFDLFSRKSPMLADLRERPREAGDLLARIWTRVCLNPALARPDASAESVTTAGERMPSLVRSAEAARPASGGGDIRDPERIRTSKPKGGGKR